MSRLHRLFFVCLILTTYGILTTGNLSLAAPTIKAAAIPKDSATFGRLPVSFEMNRGQVDPDVRYLARAHSSFIYFTETGVTVELLSREASENFQLRFSRSSPSVKLTADEQLPGQMHYFLGNDPADWKTSVPTFAKLRYSNIYPSMSVDFRGVPQGLEFDFVVEPGGDPEQISMAFGDPASVRISSEGQLQVILPSGRSVSFLAPFTYQGEDSARVEISSGYTLRADGTVGIQVGYYDPQRRLVIDPIIAFSSFLGGTQSDSANGVAVDSAGNSYIVGETRSPDFPSKRATLGPRSGIDTFVAKLDPTGQNLLFATFIGGSSDERGLDIALDRDGDIVICGETNSFNFPATLGTVQPVKKGYRDGFVAKLEKNGSTLSTATYLGGFDDDSANALALDASDNIYVTGLASVDFFTTPGAIPGGAGSQPDAFVAKITASAREWFYSGLIGGAFLDEGKDITVDSQGNAYIVGRTLSADLPVVSPFQKDSGGRTDGFVAQVSPDGLAFPYCSYLGGSGDDFANGVQNDQQGNLMIVGTTSSENFPVRLPLQPTRRGGNDAFLTILGLKGAGAIFSTYLGGQGNDTGTSIALDANRNIFVTGVTSSTDFPLHSAFQNRLAGGSDAYIAKITAQGDAFVYSSYLGGSGNDSGVAVATLGDRSAFVVGKTSSQNFPSTDSYDSTLNGGEDAFVSKISETSNLYFAQFGDGSNEFGGIKSTIRVLNLDSSLFSNVLIRLNTSAGDPMTVDLNGEVYTGQAEFTVPPNGLLSLSTDGEGDLQVGTVSVTSNTKVSGVILFQSTAGVTGVGAARLMRKFASPVQIGGGYNTGVAVMNLGPQQRVRLVLLSSEGEPIAEAREDLDLGSQFAKFITEMNWDNPPDFTSFLGSVVVTGNSDLAGMILLQTPEGLTTQPVDQKP